jgi:hypothetical protein
MIIIFMLLSLQVKLNNYETIHLKDLHNFLSVLAIAQFFGLFPFVGVFSKSINKVQFRWASFRVFHSSFWLASAIAFMYLEILQLSRHGTLNAKSISWVYLRWPFNLNFIVFSVSQTELFSMQLEYSVEFSSFNLLCNGQKFLKLSQRLRQLSRPNRILILQAGHWRNVYE